MAEIRLRSSQQAILNYQGGWMGISAVPGAGKTFTLSRLAANLILGGLLEEDQEVLIVTLVNAAVDNFASRIASFLREAGVMPGVGYTVRTLHGLANDIVRERPELAGLPENYRIVDEGESDRILMDIARMWMRGHSDWIEHYLKPDLSSQDRDQVMREKIFGLISDLARTSIRYCKDQGITPQRLREELDRLPVPLPLAEVACELYEEYQKALQYRVAVDFDDLIYLAWFILERDEVLLEQLRYRWPYILEDEAQDSSRLQEEILKKLAGSPGNWVRVGDPNQAIYETFTTANPEYLISFRKQPGVIARELPESGRSSPSIIRLANLLICWSQGLDEEDALKNGLALPLIQPTSQEDPKPNPPDVPQGVTLYMKALEDRKEFELVQQSLQRWLADEKNLDRTVAVLVPRNQRAMDIVEELNKHKIPVVDTLLKTTTQTRSAARMLKKVLEWLASPDSAVKLSDLYKVWRTAFSSSADEKPLIDRVAKWIHRQMPLEKWTFPLPGEDVLESEQLRQSDPALVEECVRFRELLRRWSMAVVLPVDQLILTLAQDLFTEPADLAVAHKLASALDILKNMNPDWQLKDYVDELDKIVQNERRFVGFSKDDLNFNPDDYKGRVVVATMHKAKGLEWDRVYLLSVNNYDFPAGDPEDTYIAENWFIRDHLNLSAELLEQLRILFSHDEYEWYREGVATLRARRDYVRERLRLLYVGITRARQELIVTWNTGRKGRYHAARALMALDDLWRQNAQPTC
ncbi:ATP-dependent helicase [Anaerolinea sp.]|uniref:ATP-dependent helicase n=1 Tax=Anaerolinea sp. TaxID=1872519 RepID=UPI002ACDE804|nr:ATP-dependent helicase [Anaerolinea sp.]